ncbi:protein nessun dorma [Lepeophtheirus salmonis]|uniref:SHC SH2 domainbinding protein 1 homolog Blike [Megachile rotundata] n=1 Tax=Lepeophtheirus salmonis TaxID=72036 RepID=A0A0K2U1T7_LEPSM|nr:protein nessun dorma-like [Lepeophtheirus salmonis]
MPPNSETEEELSRDLNLKGLPEIFSFPSSSLSRRYEDFKRILSSCDADRGVHARDIKSLWCSYLETYCELPNWLAVWTSKANSPAVHKVVDVIYINFPDLEASIEVLDDDNFIEDNEMVVPLMELYPIKNQLKEFNILSTATSLDQLRFFYNYIWKPWDVNDEVSEDWVEEHLEFRINLLTLDPYDTVRVRLDRLASQTVYNQALIKQLDASGSFDSETLNNEDETDEIIVEKYDVYLREEKIRKEVELLENPTLRLAKFRVEQNKKMENHPEGVRVSLVNPSSFPQIKSMFKTAINEQGLDEDVPLIVHATFQEALNAFLPGDVIVLCPGKHLLASIEDFSKGGTIIGTHDVIITPDEFNSSVMMNFMKNSSIKIKNVTLQTSNNSSETLFLNKDCSLELINVQIIGGLTGIFVNGGKLSMNKCSISQCYTGIEICCFEVHIQMKETEVSNCCRGLILDAEITAETLVMNEVKLLSNTSTDLYIYHYKNTDKLVKGDASLLKSISQISAESSSNTFGNVTIDPDSFYE